MGIPFVEQPPLNPRRQKAWDVSDTKLEKAIRSRRERALRAPLLTRFRDRAAPVRTRGKNKTKTKQNAASLKRSGRRQSVQPSRPALLFGLGSQPSHPHKLRGQGHNMLDRRRIRFGCPGELCATPWRIEPFHAGIRCVTKLRGVTGERTSLWKSAPCASF